MSKGYRLGSWILENWSRMALPFAVLLLCSLPVLLASDNAALVLLYTLLPLLMLHHYEEHAHGKFVDFFNSTVGEGCPVLTKSSDLLINVLGVWLVFFVSFYPAKYVVLPRDARSWNAVPEKARNAPSRKRQYSPRELTGDDPRNRSSRLP